MGFFKVDTTEDNVRDSSGSSGNWINRSGIYEVEIKAVTVNTSPGGSTYLNMWVDHKGTTQVLYRAIRVTNNDGSPNLEAKLLTKLCVVTGAVDGTELADPVSKRLPIGKDGSTEDCMVLEEFEGVPVILRMQLVYSMYDGKIQEQRIIRNFFRYEDKATASEIVNAKEFGKQFAMEEEKADTVTYKDGLTQEDVDEWKKNRAKGTIKENKPSQGFTSKRRFGKD